MPGEGQERTGRGSRAAARRRCAAARKAARTRAENARLQGLWRHEQELWRAGHELIAGVDESGVGPLAGPVVAAAAILPREFKIRGMWECKRLVADKRPHFHAHIMREALAVGVGVVEVEELDRINIHQAALKAMRMAVADLGLEPDCALVDGFVIPGLNLFQRPIIDGDSRSMSIAAASVVAKVTRDRIMERLDHIYPGYGFASHKGYGTRLHREALARLGPCPAHRRSFGPVRRMCESDAARAGEDLGAAQPEAAGAARASDRGPGASARV